jgi:hypothetical protein
MVDDSKNTLGKVAYRKPFNAELDFEAIGGAQACLQCGTPLGSDRFRSEIERAPGVKVGYRRCGRPKKVAENPTGGGQKQVGRVIRNLTP